MRVEDRGVNHVVMDFYDYVLKDAYNKPIPRLARKNYKPYWSKELDDKLPQQMGSRI